MNQEIENIEKNEPVSPAKKGKTKWVYIVICIVLTFLCIIGESIFMAKKGIDVFKTYQVPPEVEEYLKSSPDIANEFGSSSLQISNTGIFIVEYCSDRLNGLNVYEVKGNKNSGVIQIDWTMIRIPERFFVVNKLESLQAQKTKNLLKTKE
ncbi:MAG: hypothetical protein IJU47_04910 [Verrucomicrobia bacterium]|nr:hypothetical protein [Verrucomicrobiota bacterium]